MRQTPSGWRNPNHPESGSEDDDGDSVRRSPYEREDLVNEDSRRGSGFYIVSFVAVAAILILIAPQVFAAGVALTLGVLGTIAAVTYILGRSEKRSRKYED